MSNDPLPGNTRRVSMTHDGKPIGHTEPLDREWRGNFAVAKAKALARARGIGLVKAMQAKAVKRRGGISAARRGG